MRNIYEIRQDFPMLQNKQMQGHDLIYFDNSATTLKPYSVLDAIAYYYTNITSNAHRSDYDLAFAVDQAYENARLKIAELIHANKNEIVFTSGASEGLNLIAYGYGLRYLKEDDVILVSEAEHASCVLPWMRVCEKTGARLKYIPLNEEGKLTIEAFRSIMDANVKVVALAQISNVLGYEVPMKEICEFAHAYGAIVVVDGAQSVPHLPIDVKDMDCDFLTFSAHKMCGPTGIGAIYGKYEWLENIDAWMLGGGSNARFDACGHILMKKPPAKFESGTQNIEGVLGFGAAVDYLQDLGMHQLHAYEQKLRHYIVSHMKRMENIRLYNEDAQSGIITFNVKDVFAQDAASYFNAHGIAVRSGQHCAKLLSEQLKTAATVRASLYFYNTRAEADEFLKVCANADMHTCLDIYF